MTLLTPREAAAVLKIGRSTLYDWIARGIVPAIRIGTRVVRIPQEDLERALRARLRGGER